MKSENTMYATSGNRSFPNKASKRTFYSKWGLTDQISNLNIFKWNRPLSVLINFRSFFPSCSSGANDQYLEELERIPNHGDLSRVRTL